MESWYHTRPSSLEWDGSTYTHLSETLELSLLPHPSTNLPSSCYTMLQRASSLWSNPSFLSNAVSLASVGLGAIQSSNVTIAWTHVMDVGQEPLLEILHRYRQVLYQTSLLTRLHAFAQWWLLLCSHWSIDSSSRTGWCSSYHSHAVKIVFHTIKRARIVEYQW